MVDLSTVFCKRLPEGNHGIRNERVILLKTKLKAPPWMLGMKKVKFTGTRWVERLEIWPTNIQGLQQQEWSIQFKVLKWWLYVLTLGLQW